MKGLKLSMHSFMLATVLTTLLLTAQVAQAAPLSCGKWSLVPSPNPGGSSSLSGVAAVSAKNVWAVGTDGNSLTLRWNGTKWLIIKSPNPGQYSNALSGVAVISASDIWAVGDYNNNGFNQTLAEHWNGTSWQTVISPNVGTSYNFLSGVAAISANDVWAVGTYINNHSQQTLIEHWNGTTWRVVTSPNPGIYDYLYGVAAISADNVWAVGNDYNSASPEQTLIEHWNGTKWQVVTSPSPGANSYYLTGVAAVSASDIWAVGVTIDSSGISHTLIEHWNGTKWQIVKSPNPGATNNALISVAVVSANSIWTVGAYYNSKNIQRTLTAHWDGTSWKVIHSPNIKTDINNALTSASRVPGTDNIWTIGSTFFGEGSSQPITEFYC